MNTNVSPKAEEQDFLTPGPLIPTLGGSMDLPAIIYGGAALSTIYNDDTLLVGDMPLRSVRLALRYGIRAIDTSVYYGSSEIVLGKILYALRDEFPRSSYQLITKCGRYGVSSFDYSPATIRKTVKQSLERLNTDYLDVVFLHDVEFVCTPVIPRATGNHVTALGKDAAAYGLVKGDQATIRGEGDQNTLEAFHELQALQSEGLVKKIGISGYPLPTLLRLAILILHTPPYKPLDIILSYSHMCLQNSTLLQFTPHFYDRARVAQLLSASPLSMGLLTSKTPSWHPAPRELKDAVIDASKTWAGDFPNLAVGYSMHRTTQAKRPLPLVIGLSTPREVHEAVAIWRETVVGTDAEERRRGEEKAQEIIQNAGYLDWSWASP